MIELVHIDHVKEGSILGKDIVNYLGGYDLKKKGTTLSGENIKQLKSQGYHYLLLTDGNHKIDEFDFLNQVSAHRNALINKFVSTLGETVIDESKYNDLQKDELLSYKNSRTARILFEKVAQNTLPNNFIISLYKEIDTIYNLINSMDEIKINLTENRNQKVCIFGHMVDCGIYYMAIAIKLLRQKKEPPKIEQQNAILRGALGAMLHDIGYLHKKLIDLHKNIIKNNKLSDTYNKQFYKHIIVSANIIGALSTPYISESKVMCKEHHCYLDGSGLPKETKLTSEPSKILSVIDNYDILINEWFGRKNFSRQSVIFFINQYNGILFDKKITDTFLSIIRPYAINEKIILCNKKKEKLFNAEVIGYNDSKNLLPEVNIFETADGKKISPVQKKDLSQFPNIMIGELSDYLTYNHIEHKAE